MYLHNKLVKKGSLLVFKGSKFLPVLEFMFNPEEVNRSRGWLHGSAAVAGRSTPVYGGGHGSADTFQFILQLDADRGFLNERRQEGIASSEVSSWFSASSDVNLREDLRPFIDSFKRLVLPNARASQGATRSGVPQRVFLDLGSAISGEVQIDNIDERLFRFSNTMTVLKAELTISGHMLEESNVTNEDFMRQYTGAGSDLPDVVQESLNNDLPDVYDGGL